MSKKKKNHRGLLAAAAIIFSIFFLAGLLCLGAILYMDSRKDRTGENASLPTKIENNKQSSEGNTQSQPAEYASSEKKSDEAADDNKGSAASEDGSDSNETRSTEKTAAKESDEMPSEESTDIESRRTKEETSEEQTEPEESSTEDADMALKEKAISKYKNLGMITGVNNYLNMRKGPSTDTDIVGVIFKNCAVNILDEEDGWYKIESGGATGYVSSKYIATGDEARKLALEKMVYRAEVLVDGLNVRYEPNEDSDIITTIKKGERYKINGYSGDWIDVEAVEKLDGYVYKDYISADYFLDEAIVFSFDGVSEIRQNIIRKAFEYYGGSYYWGGKTLTAEGNVDCSGYTMCIYRMFDISLPEFSGAQAEVGTEVSEENIRPGDLLFYVGRYPGQIGHVAIYIGDGKIIHAASESKGICVSNWKFVPIVTIRNVIGD